METSPCFRDSTSSLANSSLLQIYALHRTREPRALLLDDADLQTGPKPVTPLCRAISVVIEGGDPCRTRRCELRGWRDCACVGALQAREKKEARKGGCLRLRKWQIEHSDEAK